MHLTRSLKETFLVKKRHSEIKKIVFFSVPFLIVFVGMIIYRVENL